MKISFTFSHPFFGDLEVEAEVEPGRPAPVCSDPSSPAFSDSGDPSDVGLLKVMWGEHDILESLTNLSTDLEDRAFEVAEEWADSRPQDEPNEDNFLH